MEPEFRYDPGVGASYVTLSNKAVVETVELGHGILVDLADDGNRVGVEIL